MTKVRVIIIHNYFRISISLSAAPFWPRSPGLPRFRATNDSSSNCMMRPPSAPPQSKLGALINHPGHPRLSCRRCKYLVAVSFQVASGETSRETMPRNVVYTVFLFARPNSFIKSIINHRPEGRGDDISRRRAGAIEKRD